MKLEVLFHSILESFALDNNKTAVAVSGGVDSIVLLHLLASWAKKNNYPTPTALTVDHRLRSESQEEANFVSNYIKQLGIESYILEWKKENVKGNVQSRAREARYKLLTEWCKNNNIQRLFVAHHRDDQAETFLLRLERGSGIDGLSSMDYKSSLNGISILRPLLDFSRSGIEKYAKFHQLKWIEDRSNQDPKYRRTLYRNLLQASNNQEIFIKRICFTALHMKRAMKALMHYARLALDECVNVHNLGYIEIKLSKFLELPEEIALRVLLCSIMAISNKHYKPRHNSLIAIFNKIKQRENDINHTLSGCKIKKCAENILIIRESSKIERITINLPLNIPIKWDNRFICTILGEKECQVTIAPLNKTHKIPEWLKNQAPCPEVLYSLPTVQKDGKVLAYPCVNYKEKNTSYDKIKCIVDCIIKETLIKSTNI